MNKFSGQQKFGVVMIIGCFSTPIIIWALARLGIRLEGETGVGLLFLAISAGLFGSLFIAIG